MFDSASIFSMCVAWEWKYALKMDGWISNNWPIQYKLIRTFTTKKNRNNFIHSKAYAWFSCELNQSDGHSDLLTNLMKTSNILRSKKRNVRISKLWMEYVLYKNADDEVNVLIHKCWIFPIFHVGTVSNIVDMQSNGCMREHSFQD